MRRFILLAGIGAALSSGAAMGQQMPGQFVGRPLLTPVGTQLPQVGTPIPKVGTPPPGLGGLSGNSFPSQTPVIDRSLIVGPVPTNMPGAAGTTPSFFDRMYIRWRELFGLSTPAVNQNNWTPGLGRRNRDRREAMWRRD